MDWYINTYSQQTTSFAIDKSLAEIYTNNLHTANKMLINHLQEIYSLRYGMYCKQTIKHLL